MAEMQLEQYQENGRFTRSMLKMEVLYPEFYQDGDYTVVGFRVEASGQGAVISSGSRCAANERIVLR